MGRNRICQIQPMAGGSGFFLAHPSSNSLLGCFMDLLILSLLHLPPQQGVFFSCIILLVWLMHLILLLRKISASTEVEDSGQGCVYLRQILMTSLRSLMLRYFSLTAALCRLVGSSTAFSCSSTERGICLVNQQPLFLNK